MTNAITLRPIEPKDDEELARIIRQTLQEFNAAKPGTVYYDPTTDNLSKVFTAPKSIYYVAELNGELLGGAGIYPTAELDSSTCELVKMYLVPSARGMGLGWMLLNRCLQFARASNYQNIYLESMPELKKAIELYEKAGFKKINAPMGKSGHSGCDIWMLLKLAD